MATVKYLPNYYDEDEEGWELEIEFPLTNKYELAEEVASDYHHRRGGWEADFPMEFRIWWENKEPIILFVDRIVSPTFHLIEQRYNDEG